MPQTSDSDSGVWPKPVTGQTTARIRVDSGPQLRLADISARVADDSESTILDRRYRLLREIGHGGMGTVYLAESVTTGERLAIKILDQNTDATDWLTAFDGFIREAKIAARIEHPNVVRMFDCSSTPEGIVYLTMELLTGRSLGALLAGKSLGWSRVLGLMRQICAGVSAIHAAGVIHRDLKPSNCLVLDDGTVKILDFGIARLEGPRRPHSARVVLGTPAYMSPEQIRGRPLDRRTDVYSAGVLLFELLARRTPFVGESRRDLTRQQLRLTAPTLASVAPTTDAPPGVQAILSRALAKRPNSRFSTIDEFDAALAEL